MLKHSFVCLSIICLSGGAFAAEKAKAPAPVTGYSLVSKLSFSMAKAVASCPSEGMARVIDFAMRTLAASEVAVSTFGNKPIGQVSAQFGNDMATSDAIYTDDLSGVAVLQGLTGTCAENGKAIYNLTIELSKFTYSAVRSVDYSGTLKSIQIKHK